MNKIIVDYLSFSIRRDERSNVSFPGGIDLRFICGLLGIEQGNFSNCGRVKYYKERYECENISICVPFESSAARQGYSVTMSGAGCRYFEASRMDGEMMHAYDVWLGLFSQLRFLTSQGLSVNISRIDIAIDDYAGYLDMERIVSCVHRDEVSTRFQTREIPQGKTDYYIAESAVRTRFYRRVRSTTVTFGSRTSRSYCRIYDKKAEQMQKHYADRDEIARLEKTPHWVRFEIEFKDENAIKMVNAFIDEPFFPRFFAEYVNGMLRFIDRDDSNVSRGTVKRWWSAFIGTTAKTALSCGEYKPVTRERHMEYVYKALTGVIYAAMNIDGVDVFLNNIISGAQSRLKPKHQKLCQGEEFNLKNLCSARLWDILRRNYQGRSVERGEYYYTECVGVC